MTWLFLLMGISIGIGDTYSRYISEASVKKVIPGGDNFQVQWEFKDNRQDVNAITIVPPNETDLVDATVITHQGLGEGTPIFLQISYPDEANNAYLMLENDDFPAGTCYSFDGKIGYSFQNKSAIPLEKNKFVLLDLPDVLSKEDSIAFRILFYKDQMLLGHNTFLVERTNSNNYNWNMVFQEKELPVLEDLKENLVWKVTGADPKETYQVELEKLTKDGYKGIPESNKMDVLIEKTNGDVAIKVRALDSTIEGTYRIKVIHYYEEEGIKVQLPTGRATFIINYK